jgi:hypothetical protein
MSNDLAAHVARHDSQIANLTDSLSALTATVNAGFKDLHGGVANIQTAVHELRSQQGPSIKDLADIGSRVILIFCGIVAGILYLSRNVASEDYHLLDKRLQLLELRQAAK